MESAQTDFPPGSIISTLAPSELPVPDRTQADDVPGRHAEPVAVHRARGHRGGAGAVYDNAAQPGAASLWSWLDRQAK